MGDPILRLEPSRLMVDPGGQCRAVVTVVNPGTVVEGYDLDVVAAVAVPWAEVTPATLSVYPQQEATATVVFSPPSGPGAPGGIVPFGVRARSQLDAGSSAVVEGDLEVGSVAGLQAKLAPVASSGRWSARHTLTVANWGNAPARLAIRAEDPDQALGFLVAPAVLDVPLGAEVTARVKVRTRHPTLRGQPKRLPFKVVCEPDPPEQVAGPAAAVSTPSRPVVDAAFNQKPILTRLVVSVAGLALVAVIGAIAFALTRGEEAPLDEARAPDAPTGLAVDAAVPGFVTLSWDDQQDVDGYTLKQSLPVSDEQDVNPTEPSLRLEVVAAGEYCYQLVAHREGAPSSAASDQACGTATIPPPPGGGTPPVPTESPTIDVVDGAEGGTDATPTTGTPVPRPTDAPLEFVAALQVLGGFADPDAEAETRRSALLLAGVPAEVIDLAQFQLDPPPLGAGLQRVVYVDGATAQEAQAACLVAESAAPELVTTDCQLPAYRVTPRPE